jgi:CubicO group peptidase (beta-lactamase class C family)
MLKRCGFLSLVTLTFCLNASAQALVGNKSASADDKTTQEQVNRLFSQWDKPDSPGAALIVYRDGQVIYKRGYGIANLEYDIPITPSTIFHVASVSKQFTAFAITMLAKQGKLSLDDDVHKYLPELPDFGKTITINHLLHHTSGIRDQWELLAMAGWRLDDVITKEHILKMVRHQEDLNFDPGTEFLYCNTGYTLLAVIVERVSGQPFRKYTEENIFKPLGMTNTHFHDDHEMIVKNRAYSYSSDGKGGFKASVLSYANVGATSLFTTVEDMAKWAQNFDDARVGGKAVIDQMYEQGVLNNGKKIDYAFGLSISQYRGLKMVEHGGADAGYRSVITRFPDQKFAVVVLSNLGNFNPTALSHQVADIYLADKLAPIPAKPAAVEHTEVKVDPAIFDSYVGTFHFAMGLTLTITKEQDRLMLQATGQPKFQLFPESESRFFLKVVDAQITFQREGTTKADGILLRQNGQDIQGKRIETLALTAAEMAEYTGNYYSDELGTTYTLVIKNGQLIAQHRRNDDISLSIAGPDRFAGNAWFFANVQFLRDAQKKITGFKLTGSRVRNLRFDKQSH